MDKSKIIIAQFYTANVSYGKYAEAINKKYCEEKGYTYFCEKNSLKISNELLDRSATWYKPKLIQEVFNTYNPEYILFMDIDAIISDFNKNIEDYIDENYNLVFTRDVSSHSVANAGVFIIKNSDWSKEFLNRWWESADIFAGKDAKNLVISEENLENIGYYKHALWHDQTCFTILHEQNEDIRNNTIIVDNRYLNCPSYDTQAFIFHAYSYGLFKNRTIDTLYYSIFNINEEGNEISNDLTEIANKYRTDKHYEHNYFGLVYSELFTPISKEINKFVEIGIGEGGSITLWRDYFSNATIYGLDINTNIPLKDNTRIELKQLNQSDTNQLEQFCLEHPDNDIDVILDDGSHKMHDQQITFAKFFKLLKPGGIYVIEDLHTSLEVVMPEKFWCAWGDPNKTITLNMLNAFIDTGKIESDYLTEEEKEYLNNNIQSIKIYQSRPDWSITSVIVKK
jgi:ubiquinone/menaquinone biosynthesis C-methylase UbiE